MYIFVNFMYIFIIMEMLLRHKRLQLFGNIFIFGIGIPWSTLRECLRTHKVFTKDQCFYLKYHKISIKSYVVDVQSVQKETQTFK